MKIIFAIVVPLIFIVSCTLHVDPTKGKAELITEESFLETELEKRNRIDTILEIATVIPIEDSKHYNLIVNHCPIDMVREYSKFED